MFGLASCANADQSSVTLSDVAKTVEVGDKFDLTATSADGSDLTWTVDSNIVTLSAETSKSGDAISVTAARVGTAKVVAEAKNGKSAECVVTVNEASATVSSIEITTPPTKTVYAVGEELDLTGLVVEAYYSNQTHRTLAASEYTVSGFSSAEDNDNVVCTVTFMGKTATFTVKVGEGPNVFMFQGFSFGGESVVSENRGKLLYWAGETGSVTNTNVDSTGMHFAYTEGWAWYSIQIFYGHPYMNAGDHFKATFKVKATVSGKITVNSETVDLVANTAKEITIENGTVGTSLAILSIQLGVNDGANTHLATGTFTISDVVIKDLTNSYYKATFTNGTDSDYYYVKKGQKLCALPPDLPDQGDNIFVGWLDANGNPAASDYVVNSNVEFTATFLPESQVTKHNVKIYRGDSVYQTIKVVDGRKLDQGKIDAPFAAQLLGLYTNSALTSAFDANTLITGDTNLFGKFVTKCSGTYFHAIETDWKIPDVNLENTADGALHCFGVGCWNTTSENAWMMQINFDLPLGVSSENYIVEFDYKVTLAGGIVKVIDNDVRDSTTLAVANTYSHITLHYQGGRAAGCHLEFDLAGITSSGTLTTVDIHINNVTCVKVN